MVDISKQKYDRRRIEALKDPGSPEGAHLREKLKAEFAHKPAPSDAANARGGSIPLVSSTPYTAAGEVTKQQLLVTASSKIKEERSNIQAAKKMYQEVKPSSKFLYTVDGKTYTGHQTREILAENIKQRERNLVSLESSKKTIQGTPSGSTFKVTDSGYELSDSSLKWGKKQFKNIQSTYEEQGPVLGALHEVGFSLFSHTASSALSAMKHSEALVMPVGPAAGQIKAGIGDISRTGVKLESKIHFPVVTDVVFEPLGLAPVGSSELVRKHPVFATTGVAFEAVSAYAFGKVVTPMLKPVTKPITTRISKYGSKIFNKIKPSNKFALKGTLYKPAFKIGTKTESGLSARLANWGDRLGLGRSISQTDDIVYKTQRAGIPMVTESGRVVFRPEKYFTTGKLPKYGGTDIYAAMSYDPESRKMLLNLTRVTSQEYKGLFRSGVNFKIERGVIAYENLGFPSSFKPVNVAARPVVRGFNIGGTTRDAFRFQPVYKGVMPVNVSTGSVSSGGGFSKYVTLTRQQMNILKLDVNYEPVSRLFPSSMAPSYVKVASFNLPSITRDIVSRATGVLGGAAPLSVGGLSSRLVRFTGSKPSKFTSKNSNVGLVGIRGVGLGFKPLIGGRTSSRLDVVDISSVAVKSASIFDVRSVFGSSSHLLSIPAISTVSIPSPKPSLSIPVFPSLGLYVAGRKGFSFGKIGFKHSFRVKKLKPLIKGWKV